MNLLQTVSSKPLPRAHSTTSSTVQDDGGDFAGVERIDDESVEVGNAVVVADWLAIVSDDGYGTLGLERRAWEPIAGDPEPVMDEVRFPGIGASDPVAETFREWEYDA
jgi:hypothetical protein